eukprot:726270-Rhodomonas_salina.4
MADERFQCPAQPCAEVRVHFPLTIPHPQPSTHPTPSTTQKQQTCAQRSEEQGRHQIGRDGMLEAMLGLDDQFDGRDSAVTHPLDLIHRADVPHRRATD